MSQLKAKVLVMAGGTGGHIFPGLAVAQALQARGWQASWLGSQGGMEEKLVAGKGIDLNLISVSGLRGKGLLGWLAMPVTLTRAVWQSVKVLRKVKPDIVVGFGGFASGPGGLAAFLTGTPLVIHEQNAVAGMTNKVLAKLSKRVFEAFPGAFAAAKKVETVGNPVRKEIAELHQKLPKTVAVGEPINILVVGGSRGALALNKQLPMLLANKLQQGKLVVRHQVGQGRLAQTEDFYQAAGINPQKGLKLSEFIDDMAAAFSWADLVICRAGASTVSEISVVGRCAVFVPYPYAVDDHQTANAAWLAAQNAALCVQENKLETAEFSQQLNELIESPARLSQMGEQARSMAYLDAAEKLADYCDASRKAA